MADSKDNLVEKFCSITDTTPSVASRLLLQSGNDLTAALSAYYDQESSFQKEVREPIAPVKGILVEDSPVDGFSGFQPHNSTSKNLVYSSANGESHSFASGSFTTPFGSFQDNTASILRECLFLFHFHH